MSDNEDSSNRHDSNPESKRYEHFKKLVAFETLLKVENSQNKENKIMFSNLLNKRVKIWCIFADTVGGVRGTWKGTAGTVTAVDDEFICLDDSVYIRRVLIYRIELI